MIRRVWNLRCTKNKYCLKKIEIKYMNNNQHKKKMKF